MLKPILILCLLTVSYYCQAQNTWINKYTDPILQDQKGSFSNLAVLAPALKDVSVVTLGEQTHFDGATFDAKIQLIKYLHEQLGFNILAFESGYFDCTKASQLLSKNRMPGTLKDAVFGVWDNQSLAELEHYVIATQQTAHPLILTGFDSQFSGKLSGKYLLSDLAAYLDKVGASSITDQTDWKDFKSAVQRQLKYSNFYKKPLAKDTLLIAKYSKTITNQMDSRSAATDQHEHYFWRKVISNLVYDTKHRYSGKNFRDSVMAVNLLSLITERYPNEKVICWGATSHFIYNPKQINSKGYEDFLPMGDELHQKLGTKLFTIGFTSYEGRAGSLITHQLKKPTPNSYEDLLGQTAYHYAFTNLRAAATAKNDSTVIESRMLGNTFNSMDLSKVIDGLFYIKTAYPPRSK